MPEKKRKPGIDDVSLLRRAHAANIDTAVQQLRLIHELKQERRGGNDNAPPARKRQRQSEGGIEDFLFDLARLSVNHYDQWLRLSEKHFPDIVTTLRQLSGRPSPDVLSPAAIHLQTVSNATVLTSQPFSIENPFDTEVSLTFGTLSLSPAADGSAAPSSLHHPAFVRVKESGKPTGTPLKPGESFKLASGAKALFRVEMNSATLKLNGVHVGKGRVLAGGKTVALMQIEIGAEPA